MIMSRWFCLTIAVISVYQVYSRPCSAQDESKPQAESVAGCYELRMGRWWPWSLGEDAKFVTPPSRFELTLQRGTEGFAKDQLMIRQIPARESSRQISYWMVIGRNRAALIWSNGLSGVSVNVRKKRDGFSGFAHAHFDFPRASHIAHVTARRIPCQSPLPLPGPTISE